MHWDVVIYLVISFYLGKRIYDLINEEEHPMSKAEPKNEPKKYEGPFAKEINQINEFDKTFTLPLFLINAQKSFELILASYAKGDEGVLKKFVNEKMFEALLTGISARKGQDYHFELIRFLKTELLNLLVEGKKITAKVKFNTEQLTYLKDEKGKVIMGDSERIQNIADTWVFTKDYSISKDTFKLVDTIAKIF
jgi:predicted lipid-binding transport protein (Tim44 family)